jgi:hypothetical protein
MSDVIGIPIKDQAPQLVQSLPANATWDDHMYRIYVRQAIESGLKDADAGRVVDAAEVRRRFGLAP